MVAVQYRMTIDGKDVSCSALTSWNVTLGRTSPDTQPDAGSGSFSLFYDAGDRAPQIKPRSTLRFEASVDAGATWLPVCDQIVATVTRDFEWANTPQGRTQRNRLGLTTEGRSVLLERQNVEQSYYLSDLTNPLTASKTDGQVVWDQLQGVSGVTAAASIRSPSSHIVNDRPAAGDGSWTTTVPVTGSAAVVPRTATGNTGGGTVGAASDTFELELRFSSTVPVEVRFRWRGRMWQARRFRFPTPGTHVLTELVKGEPGINPLAFDFQFRAYNPAGTIWSNADPFGPKWSDATVRWQDIDPPTGGDVTIADVDLWDYQGGWAWGTGLVELRNLTVDIFAATAATETRLAYIRRIGTAFRAALWELRDGRLLWQGFQDRDSTQKPVLDLPSCDVLVSSRSTSALEGIVNTVTAYWGPKDANGDRGTVYRQDTASFQEFGELRASGLESTTAPIHDQAYAQYIIDQVVRTHAQPVENLPDVQVLPFESLTATQVTDLLRLPPNALLGISATPAGWVKSPDWWGWVQGTTISGTRGRTDMTLQVAAYELEVSP